MSDPSYYGSSQQDLIQQVVDQSGGDVSLEEALLWGAQGESGTGSNMGGPSAGGFFGFTPPENFGLTFQTAQEAGPAVAAILPSYQSAEASVPSNLSGLAKAEYIAIGGERPAFDTEEQAQIAATGQPLTSNPYNWPGGDYGGSYIGPTSFTYGENTDPTIGTVVSQELGTFIPTGGGTGAGPGGSGTPGLQLTSLTSAQKGTKATGGLDPVTSVLVALDHAMNPPIVKAGLLGTLENIFLPTKWEGDVRDFVVMNLTRLGFAAGFFAIGVAGLFRVISGGRVSGKDIPGLAAGFIAGPEAGLLNALGRFTGGTIRGPQRTDEEAQARRERSEARQEERLAFARTRESRAAQAFPGQQERAESGELRALAREGRAQRGEIRAEAGAARADIRENRLERSLQTRQQGQAERAASEQVRQEQARQRLQESMRSRVSRTQQQESGRQARGAQFRVREERLGRLATLREQTEPERVQQGARRLDISAENADLRRWALEMQAARQRFERGFDDWIMEER